MNLSLKFFINTQGTQFCFQIDFFSSVDTNIVSIGHEFYTTECH